MSSSPGIAGGPVACGRRQSSDYGALNPKGPNQGAVASSIRYDYFRAAYYGVPTEYTYRRRTSTLITTAKQAPIPFFCFPPLPFLYNYFRSDSHRQTRSTWCTIKNIPSHKSTLSNCDSTSANTPHHPLRRCRTGPCTALALYLAWQRL